MKVPVYLTVRRVKPDEADVNTKTEVSAECAKCGKCAAADVSEDPADGTRAARVKVAKVVALENLTDLCDERLPWGIAPAHGERFIPRGVSVFFQDSEGKLLPLALTKDTAAGRLVTVVEQGKVEVPHLGIPLTVAVLVIPESEKHVEAADKFARELMARGYKQAQVRLATKAA